LSRRELINIPPLKKGIQPACGRQVYLVWIPAFAGMRDETKKGMRDETKKGMRFLSSQE
jgi:hypothetical protein